ncbi:hypothetical protein B0I73DRAFT_39464 [Yarrowia lipolytica]|nr:hypothetical protein B0I73DRAFT_39464 [Yarrowia lipolytica]
MFFCCCATNYRTLSHGASLLCLGTAATCLFSFLCQDSLGFSATPTFFSPLFQLAFFQLASFLANLAPSYSYSTLLCYDLYRTDLSVHPIPSCRVQKQPEMLFNRALRLIGQ